MTATVILAAGVAWIGIGALMLALARMAAAADQAIASQVPTEGGAATTPVEARGCPDNASGCRGRNRKPTIGRAAGALLTGQCQDGSSQAPADAQFPALAHGGRRASLRGRGHA